MPFIWFTKHSIVKWTICPIADSLCLLWDKILRIPVFLLLNIETFCFLVRWLIKIFSSGFTHSLVTVQKMTQHPQRMSINTVVICLLAYQCKETNTFNDVLLGPCCSDITQGGPVTDTFFHVSCKCAWACTCMCSLIKSLGGPAFYIERNFFQLCLVFSSIIFFLIALHW